MCSGTFRFIVRFLKSEQLTIAFPQLTDLGQLIGDVDVCENHTVRVGTNSFSIGQYSIGQYYVETLELMN